MKKDSKKLYEKLPDTPGVYLMRDARGELLYVGKAGNLKRRVSSYFLRPHDARIERLVSRIANIDHEKTDTAVEALIREAELIKENEPPFNIKDKDNKSFLYVQITKEAYPRILLARGRDLGKEDYRAAAKYGPFTSASSLREALKIIRRIFPFSTHPPEKINSALRPCFDHEIGLCPGVCAGKMSRSEYGKNIRNIKLFFEGRKERILRELAKDMSKAAKEMDFEEAERLKRQIFSLKHIQDIAFISEDKVADPEAAQLRSVRIEGYDISNISGVSSVGSMVVFVDSSPDKNEYRKFKIRTVEGANDVGMLTEVLERRFSRTDWPMPDMVLVDGGIAQVNAARTVLARKGIKIPVIGMAKGPARKRTDIVGLIPKNFQNADMKTLVHVRDEAHRFAVSYHKNLRSRNFFE